MPAEISTVLNPVDEPPSCHKSPDAKITRVIFSPDQPGRQGVGGLRTQSKFKESIPGKPLVSILTAVFNGAQFLEQTIQSVMKQDYSNIEFIVIDGGSTDGTLDILRKYENVIDYWISEPDRGISDAFNKAVLLSSGDYLNFQGAGDLLVAGDVVSRMLEGIDPRRDMLISGRVQRVKEHDPNEILWVAPRRFSPTFNKRSLLFRMSLPHQGLLTNRRMFERYGLFDTHNVFSMDYEHLLRAYHEFPHVVMKDVIFSAWREGGVGFGRYGEILQEYSNIKKKNKVAPTAILELLNFWSFFKWQIKKIIGRGGDTSVWRLDLMKCQIPSHEEYDWIFVSHLPSFYKINLFNKIAKSASVLVIFLGETSQERTADFVNGDKQFDHVFLNAGDFEQRSFWRSSWKLVRILLKLKYKRLSVGGWDLPESWVAISCSHKNANVITQESSIFESKLTGVKSLLKRIFVKRLSLALVSGLPHARLMRAVGFDGEIMVTGGVGLTNRAQRIVRGHKEFSGRFLYVGRLSPEKNLAFLLRVFALPSMAVFHLTLVGNGPEREALRSLAGRNVTFVGHVPNERIHEIYEENDVFILPSLSEVWGLVVEEALYYGLPVLVSSKVGSVEDLVVNNGAGLVFDPLSESSLQQAIETVATQYERYARAARAIDFDDRDDKQVNVYVEALYERGGK